MSFLSKLHNQLRQARVTKRGATHRPEQVPTGVHKSYERMTQIPLPPPLSITNTLESVLRIRKSYVGGDSSLVLPLQDIATLLGLSLGRHKDSVSRNYPSGGALFPIETYIIATTLEGFPPAVFHYNPTMHALEMLWELEPGFEMQTIVPSAKDIPVSTLIVFTACWKRSSAKYGELAYLHSLLEAGHMSQNILLVSTALGLASRPMAGFDDHILEKILDLDPAVEQPVHTVTLCTL